MSDGEPWTFDSGDTMPFVQRVVDTEVNLRWPMRRPLRAGDTFKGGGVTYTLNDPQTASTGAGLNIRWPS